LAIPEAWSRPKEDNENKERKHEDEKQGISED
jgi:hypothetical protein